VNKKHAKAAALSMASLYGWGAVIDLLEGSSAPEHSAAVSKVIKIAKAECQRHLAAYDRHIAKIDAAAPGVQP